MGGGLPPRCDPSLFHKDRLVQGLTVAVKIAHKRSHAAFKIKGVFPFLVRSLIFKGDADAFGHKGHLTETGQQSIPLVNIAIFEDFLIVAEGNFGTGRPLRSQPVNGSLWILWLTGTPRS